MGVKEKRIKRMVREKIRIPDGKGGKKRTRKRIKEKEVKRGKEKKGSEKRKK